MSRKETEIEKSIHGNVFLRLMGYAKPYAGSMVIAMLLVLAITGLELLRPILLGKVVDDFTMGGSFTEIKRMALLYFLVLTVTCIFNMTQTWILQKTGQKIIYHIREEVFAHIEQLSLRFFDVTPVGKIVTRATNDVEALHEMYANILVKLIKNSVKIIGLAVVMFMLNVKIAMLAFLVLPFVVYLTWTFKKISRAAYRITRTKITSINTYLSEHLSGMKLIQIFAREKEKNAEFRQKSKELYDANNREMMIFAIFRPLTYMTSVISLIIIIASGSKEVLNGVITVGILYAFIQYIGSFFEPIQELAEQFGTLQSAMASAEKIFTILDEPVAVANPIHPVCPEKISGKIEFEHVWFAYDNVNWILKDVSFVIEPGQSAAFVGATGAGKSSILNLIGRYYDIQKGRILIDGIDIKELDLDTLRSAIGQVQQDVFLFTGDVLSNIRLKNEGITKEQAKKAAEYVNADHFINALPKKMEEPVTERGTTLSAGQRQLLSFARTLAYHPAILVMDEATANIDTETELLIQKAVTVLMEGRTTIMVAHRLSTIQHANQIIVMHKGRIRERGTHQELLAQNGIYKKLYQLQIS